MVTDLTILSQLKADMLRSKEELAKSQAVEVGFTAAKMWIAYSEPTAVIPFGRMIARRGSCLLDASDLPELDATTKQTLPSRFESGVVAQIWASPKLMASYAAGFGEGIECWTYGVQWCALLLDNTNNTKARRFVEHLLKGGDDESANLSDSSAPAEEEIDPAKQ